MIDIYTIEQELIRLRDELHHSAFTKTGAVKDYALAAIVFKIDTCLSTIWIGQDDSSENLLEKFGESLVRECAEVARQHNPSIRARGEQ